MIIAQRKNHFLLPSQLFTDPEPHFVKTVLGSCIAVCLYDDKLKIGGINHYMMPWWNGKGLPSPKYGDIAIEKLVEKMMALGSQKRNLVAKVFGGASQLGNGDSHFQIGARNISTAQKLLTQHAIPTVAMSVGGTLGRQIMYDTGTGKVLVKILERTNS